MTGKIIYCCFTNYNTKTVIAIAMANNQDCFDVLKQLICFNCDEKKGDFIVVSPLLEREILRMWRLMPHFTSACNHCSWIVTSCAGIAIESEDGKIQPLIYILAPDAVFKCATYDEAFAGCSDASGWGKIYSAFSKTVASAREFKDWHVVKSKDLHSLPHGYPVQYTHFDCRGMVDKYDQMRQVVKDIENMDFIQEQVKTLMDAMSSDFKFIIPCIDELLKQGVPWESNQISNLVGCHDFIMKAFTMSADTPDYDENMNTLMFQYYDVLKPCLETGSFGKNSILYDMIVFCQDKKDGDKVFKPKDVVKMFYGFLRKRMLVDGGAWACKGKAKEWAYGGAGGVDSPPQKVADLQPDEQKDAICGYVCGNLDYLSCPMCHTVRHTGMKKWACPTCTFGNKLEDALCEMCNTARPH